MYALKQYNTYIYIIFYGVIFKTTRLYHFGLLTLWPWYGLASFYISTNNNSLNMYYLLCMLFIDIGVYSFTYYYLRQN